MHVKESAYSLGAVPPSLDGKTPLGRRRGAAPRQEGPRCLLTSHLVLGAGRPSCWQCPVFGDPRSADIVPLGPQPGGFLPPSLGPQSLIPKLRRAGTVWAIVACRVLS